MERSGTPTVGSGLRTLLAADAGWDAVFGVAFCLATWTPAAEAAGLPTARPAWLFLVIGLGCLAFAVLLARAARGIASREIACAAAIGNAVAALVVVVALLVADQPPVRVVWLLGIAAAGCAVFAVLEARFVRR